MFGMTAVTAWELEAERRRELASSWRPLPRPDVIPRQRARPIVSLRRLIGFLGQVPPSGWEDVRT